jgi:O-antigen ligase
VIMSIPMKPKLWEKLPYVVLAVTLFDLMIALITNIFPNSVYVIYPFYSAVSTGSLEEVVTGSTDITGRVGAFGNFGVVLITLVLASVSLSQILHPSNFFRLITLIGGSISVLYSGFRSAVFNAMTVVLAAGIRDLKLAVLAFLPVVAIALFTVSVVNSDFVKLPKQIQRSLTFLPGNWDPEMVMDANASNDFRRQVWTLWLRDYFPAQPFFGRGFGFKSEWAEKLVYNYNAISNRQAIETGNIHNGFLATLDCFGIVGTFFFVIWNFRLLVRTFKVARPEKEPGDFTLRFIALYLAAWIVCYWMGAATVGSFLPREFALAAVFLRLQRERAPQTIGPAVPDKLEPTRRGALTPA